jgi:hypothetical protein
VPKLQAYEKGADECAIASLDKIEAAMGGKIEAAMGGRCRLAQLHQVKRFKSRKADGRVVGVKAAPVAQLQVAKRPMPHADHWATGQISRPCRFVTRQLMLVPRRAVSHATIRLAALSRHTLLYRVVGTF